MRITESRLRQVIREAINEEMVEFTRKREAPPSSYELYDSPNTTIDDLSDLLTFVQLNLDYGGRFPNCSKDRYKMIEFNNSIRFYGVHDTGWSVRPYGDVYVLAKPPMDKFPHWWNITRATGSLISDELKYRATKDGKYIITDYVVNNDKRE